MKHDPDTVFTEWQGPLGPMILAATPRGLSGVWFEGQRHGPDTSAWKRAAEVPVLERAMTQLAAYFAGRRKAFDVPLDLSGGTDFQQRVWQALLEIAPGGTTSYGALSERIGNPAAVRAVGAAVGRNPVSIVVPCHRVIGTNGSLTGYAGGLDRKTALLSLEGALLH
ncbi:methylated-DNA--[protein]-cysteine S-methyltransferase [Hydrogenophaga sp.]|jgi:methylated-DNA-[protein]-cysteine S-methyltransferase|uniref:methylated-DNA--[protein]-cysteine S-methyltransferase n=1 Tax=Hydrogenophaga sp. TaxID=1904254 RepID=UPI003F701EB6